MTYMTKYQKLKAWLAAHIFKDEVLALRSERNRLKALNDEKAQRLSEVTLVDLVREQLKGFNPRMLDKEGDILELYQGEDSERMFLEQVKSLHDNPARKAILEYLTREQVLFSAKEAREINSVNFGRATINGFTLFDEEVDRLYLIHQERTKGADPFNKHDIT